MELHTIRDSMGKLLQELSTIRESNHVMRRSIQEVSATVGDVSDKMTDMHSRLDDVHALMILLVVTTKPVVKGIIWIAVGWDDSSGREAGGWTV